MPLSRRHISILAAFLIAAVACLFGSGAAQAASVVSVSTNIPYITTDGQQQMLDAYIPNGLSAPTPAVIYVHGGAWSGGDKSRWSDWPQKTAQNMGFPTFNINYTLISSNPAWEELVDVANSVAWVKAHAAQYHVDPNRIALVGESAGGHLAELTGTFPLAQQYRPKLVVSLSGIADTRLAASDGNCLLVACILGNNAQTVASYIQSNLVKTAYPANPQAWVNAAPVTYASANSTPMLLINSTNELVPLDQLTSMQAALTAHGVPVQTLVLPGTEHAVDYMGQVAWSIMQYLTANL